MADNLIESLADLKEEVVITLVEKRIMAGEDPLSILEDARKGMELVGEKFEKGDFFLGELVYSGDIFKQVSRMIKPYLQHNHQDDHRGNVIMGTVAGDLHDIGKNILISLLEANGFQVHDLGVDVPPEKFVEKIKETGATIVGLSALLTAAIDSMKMTVETIRKAPIGNIQIMIGGAPTDEEAKQYTGADAWGRSAQDGVTIAKQWTV